MISSARHLSCSNRSGQRDGVTAVKHCGRDEGDLLCHASSVSTHPRTLHGEHRFSSYLNSIRLLNVSLLALILVSLLIKPASATLTGAYRDRHRSAAIDSLAQSGELLVDLHKPLLVDRSEPPVPPHMRLLRREGSHSTASSASSTAPTSTKSASASATTLATVASPSGSAIPTPFDTNLGSNFTTASCPAFFNKFLSNATFQSCHPLSLLLQNSNSFFDASKSFVRITQTLDATCNVDFKNTCLPLMQYYANTILSPNNCQSDYSIGNAMVVQAYRGLLSYEPLFKAGCLRDTKGGYCFANAITNKSSVADSYPYYLPLGIDLPGSSRPTCDFCLQETMTIFNGFAGNSSQPVSKTYGDAAQQINIGCGPKFINTTVLAVSSAAVMQSISLTPLLGLITTLLFFFL